MDAMRRIENALEVCEGRNWPFVQVPGILIDPRDVREVVALAKETREVLEAQALECERFVLISGTKAAERFRAAIARLAP